MFQISEVILQIRELFQFLFQFLLDLPELGFIQRLDSEATHTISNVRTLALCDNYDSQLLMTISRHDLTISI